MSRDAVLDLVLSARTVEECAHARRVLSDWATAHPHDTGILWAGEQLALVSAGADLPASQGEVPEGFDPFGPEADAYWGTTFEEQVGRLVAQYHWDEAETRGHVLRARLQTAAEAITAATRGETVAA
jgi:hypothetical protein